MRVYVTASIGTQVLQCYVPNRMWPSFTATDIGRFKAFDRKLSQSGSMDLDAVSAALTTVRTDSAERCSGVRAALNIAAMSSAMDVATVKRVNSSITGNTAAYRSGFAWSGAVGPRLAWHVGSPPDAVPRLMNSLIASSSRADLPATAVALVLAVRLLQIHPFRDGNGRTARVLLWSVLTRRCGRTLLACELITWLWRRCDFDLHAASNDIRDHEDWSALMDRVFELLH